MHDRVKITAKSAYAKKENSAYHTQRTGFSQSSNLPIEQILHLQRTVGNRAVQRLFRSGVIQAKLRIGQPTDIYEQEADRVVDKVMRMPNPLVQRQKDEEEEELIQTKPIAGQITPLVQRQVEEEKEEEAPIQTKSLSTEQPIVQRQVEPKEEEEEEFIQTKAHKDQTPETTPTLTSQIQSLKGGGHPLPDSTRAYFEPRFGADFSRVRIHNNSKAAETAKSVNARVFTTEGDIIFGAGQYSPNTSTGKRLLAHELTHVVQQKSLDISRIKRQMASTEESISAWPYTKETWKSIQSKETGIKAANTEKISEQSGASIKEKKVKNAIKHMKNDINKIVDILGEWVIDGGDENAILSYIKKWDNLDEQTNKQYGTNDTSFLDTFLFQLEMRGFWKGTARTAWIDFYTSVFDDLFRELEDERLVEFKRLLSKSKKYSGSQPKPLPPSFYKEVVGKTFRQYPAAATGFIAGVAEKAGFVPFIGPWIKKEVAPFYHEYAEEVAKFYGVEKSERKKVIERGMKVGRIEMSFLRGYYAIYVLLGNIINVEIWAAKNPEKVIILWQSLKASKEGLSYLKEKYPEYVDYMVEMLPIEEIIRQLIIGAKNLSLEAWAEILGATAKFSIKLLKEGIKKFRNIIAFAILQLIRFTKLAALQRIEDLKGELRELGERVKEKDVEKLINKLKEIMKNLESIEKIIKELEKEGILE